MSTTLFELVYDQVVAEAPRIEDPAHLEDYVYAELNEMTNVELLERISDALRHAATNMPVRPWL